MSSELPRTFEILNFKRENVNISKARWRHATAVKQNISNLQLQNDLPARHHISSDETLTCQPGCIKILWLASNTNNDHRVWHKVFFRML